MSNWREPITDRTLQDVKKADAGSLEYQKGTLNADDLNRIEDNYKYLMAKLRSDAIFIPHRLRNYTEMVLEYVQKETSTLPEGYTQVEYIESSGTQYIDTGFVPNQDTRVVMDFAGVNVGSDNVALFGARTGSTANVFALWVSKSAINPHYGNVAYNTKTISMTCNQRLTYDMNKNVTTVGTTSATFSKPTFSSGCSLYLFALNANGTVDDRMVSGKLYSCKIYDNGTLIRNFIPCKNASGTVGLYDLVNNKFYANAGSGTFTAGIEIEPETTYELVETKTTYTDWQERNLPWLSEINRIRANYNALVRLFLVGLGLPVLAESNYLDWQEVNDWERIAEVGKTMFENMEKEYRYCGMEESGGDRLL